MASVVKKVGSFLIVLILGACAAVTDSPGNGGNGGTGGVDNGGGDNPLQKVALVSVTAPATLDVDSEILLATSTQEAQIRYTLDGTTPTENSTLYQGAFKLAAGNHTFTARGFKTGMTPSDPVTLPFNVSPRFDGVIIYLKSASVPTLWVWNSGGTGITDKMTDPATNLKYTWATQPKMVPSAVPGWYKHEIPAQFLATPRANLVMKFNQGAEVPRNAPTGGWYDGANWYLSCPDVPQIPSITVAPGAGTYRGTQGISLSLKRNLRNFTSKSAVFAGKTVPLPDSNTADISLSLKLQDYLVNGASGTLTIAAANSVGAAQSVSLTFTRDDSVVIQKPFTWDNALVYFVLTDRFLDGDPSNNNSYGRETDQAGNVYAGYQDKWATFNGGDLKGLTQKLNQNYFSDLGVNAIWITAPYEQIHGWIAGKGFKHYAYHGYYTLDYTAVDKNMGTMEDLRTFVDTAHSQGIRVIFDVVMNHAGYESMADMAQYDFGELTAGWQNYYYTSSEAKANYWEYEDFIGKTSADRWGKWWSPSWMRKTYEIHDDTGGTTGTASMPGYDPIDGSDEKKCLDGLPDFKTENSAALDLPPVLKTKWAQEATGFEAWTNPSALSLRKNLNTTVAAYQAKWLAAWVRELGIDGFRVDTAKHVTMDKWALLKDEANLALDAWRAANPDKAAKVSLPLGKTKGNFWMTGEVWGHGVSKSPYFTTGKFDSIINFTFPKDGSTSGIASTWKGLADALNNDPDFDVLSYISSHDTDLGGRGNLIGAGTALLLAPGGVQIFYGDETGRTKDSNRIWLEPNRTKMNWSSVNTAALTHWQKLGKFRNNHISVGGGSQADLGGGAYGRVYDKNGYLDKVVIAINQTGTVSLNVGTIFPDGTQVRNAYDGSIAPVVGGKVSFSAINGVILVDEVQ